MTVFWLVAGALQLASILWLLYLKVSGASDSAVWRVWSRVLAGPIPTPDDVQELLGPAMELVVRAADPDDPLDAAQAKVDATRRLFDDWAKRLNFVRPDEPLPRVPAARLRMRPLRLLAHCEALSARLPQLDRALPWFRRVNTLRRSLGLLGRALHRARRLPPEARRRRLAEIHADLDVLVRNCVETHALLSTAFVRWQAQQGSGGPAGGAPA